MLQHIQSLLPNSSLYLPVVRSEVCFDVSVKQRGCTRPWDCKEFGLVAACSELLNGDETLVLTDLWVGGGYPTFVVAVVDSSYSGVGWGLMWYSILWGILRRLSSV